MELNGTTPGTVRSLNVRGTVNLAGVVGQPVLGFTARLAPNSTLISTTATTP